MQFYFHAVEKLMTRVPDHNYCTFKNGHLTKI